MKGRDGLLILSLVLNIVVSGVLTMLYPFSAGGPKEAKGSLFTFAHITDSQFSGSSAIFEKATSWLARQDNLSFVVHTGDIVNNPFDETAWKNAYRYMHQLDNRCDWAALAGDNDVVSKNQVYLANFRNHFSNNSVDQYFVVEDRLLFILLSWNNVDGSISRERLSWMDQVIQEHQELNVIMCLHSYLFGFPFLNILRAPNADEIWTHIDKHDNVIMTLSGHIHQNWVRIHTNGQSKVWSVSTEALMEEGCIRLFDVYEDKIEVHAYSPWTNKTYTGPLDCFTIELNPNSWDVDGDLWSDDSDIMPTHPLVPNMIVFSVTTAIAVVTVWARARSSHQTA